jgi:hypothetical protein
MEDFQEILQPVLATIMTLIVGLLAAVAQAAIKGATAWIQSKTNNEHLTAFIAEVEHVVLSINQTVVDETKKASADGRITEQERKAILGKARMTAELEVKRILTHFPKAFQTFIGDKVEHWVESAVAKVKIPGNPS